MPIHVVCSSCGKQLSAPDKAAGRKAKCPKCSAAVQVPHSATRLPAVEAIPSHRPNARLGLKTASAAVLFSVSVAGASIWWWSGIGTRETALGVSSTGAISNPLQPADNRTAILPLDQAPSDVQTTINYINSYEKAPEFSGTPKDAVGAHVFWLFVSYPGKLQELSTSPNARLCCQYIAENIRTHKKSVDPTDIRRVANSLIFLIHFKQNAVVALPEVESLANHRQPGMAGLAALIANEIRNPTPEVNQRPER